MKFEGQITVNAPLAEVYAVLSDIDGFAALVDGLGEVVRGSDGQVEATFTTKVAYMSFTFKVSIVFTHLEAPETLTARIEGKPLGIIGQFSAVSTSVLSDLGGSTLIAYHINASLMGKLGSIGQPVLQSKARDMEKQFEKNLLRRFNTKTPAL